MLMEILDSLPDDQRISVMMYFYEQKTTKEIAEELGCKEVTVKARIRYAKAKIKESVLNLEKKQGIKLYNLAPLPFFIALLRGCSSNAGNAIESAASAVAVSGNITSNAVAASEHPGMGKFNPSTKPSGNTVGSTSAQTTAGTATSAGTQPVSSVRQPSGNPASQSVSSVKPSVNSPAQPMPKIPSSNTASLNPTSYPASATGRSTMPPVPNHSPAGAASTAATGGSTGAGIAAGTAGAATGAAATAGTASGAGAGIVSGTVSAASTAATAAGTSAAAVSGTSAGIAAGTAGSSAVLGGAAAAATAGAVHAGLSTAAKVIITLSIIGCCAGAGYAVKVIYFGPKGRFSGTYVGSDAGYEEYLHIKDDGSCTFTLENGIGIGCNYSLNEDNTYDIVVNMPIIKIEGTMIVSDDKENIQVSLNGDLAGVSSGNVTYLYTKQH